MRAVAPPPPAPWLFLPGQDDGLLIGLRHGRQPAQRRAGLARFPSGWSEVPDSRIRSPLQTFVSYQRAGIRQANYHCAALPDAEPTARAIARVNLGECRVFILPAAHGYEARWTCGDLWHRVSGGPADLGGFMELVLALGLAHDLDETKA